MKAWLASVWLLELLFLQDALAHKLHSSTGSIVKKAQEHRAVGLGNLRQGAAARRDQLLESILHVPDKDKRAAADITWEVTPFNPTSIPLAVRR